MSDKSTNLKIWSQVDKTDPSFTKQFSRGGGFRGTATNATWLAKRATEVFGPIGFGWGTKVLDEKYQQGAGDDIVHIIRIEFWYIADGKRCSIEQYGQTMFVSKNKNGLFTDEEAPKKSLTDAMTKALSLLGFAADVHMGFYDDSKYVAAMDREFAEKARQEREAAKAAAASAAKPDDQLPKPDNVVPMKKAEAPAAEPPHDADGVIDEGQVALAEMKAAIDGMATSGEITVYMTGGGLGLKKLEPHGQAIINEGRAYAGVAFKRLKAKETQPVEAAE